MNDDYFEKSDPMPGEPAGAAIVETPTKEAETKVTETVNGEAPKGPTPTATIPATPPPFNPKEIFGLDTVDDVKAELENGKKYRTELETLRQEKLAYEEKMPEYSSEAIAGFDQFVRATKIESFELYNKLKTANVEDPLDALVLKHCLDNPRFIGKEKTLKEALIQDYKIDAEKNEPGEIELGTVRLEKDAADAMKAINEVREAMGKKPVTQKAQPIDMAKLKEDWKPLVEKSLSQITALEIPIQKGDKVEKFMDYAIDDAMKSDYKESLSQVMVHAGPVSEETAQNIKAEFDARFFLNNLPKIVHSIVTKVESETKKEYDAKYHGMVPLKEAGGAGGNDPDKEKQFFDDVYGPKN